MKTNILLLPILLLITVGCTPKESASGNPKHFPRASLGHQYTGQTNIDTLIIGTDNYSEPTRREDRHKQNTNCIIIEHQFLKATHAIEPKSGEIKPVDVYLIQFRIPDGDWQTREALYFGDETIVCDENNLTIKLE